MSKDLSSLDPFRLIEIGDRHPFQESDRQDEPTPQVLTSPASNFSIT
ncbi:hypothetical protein [Chlorogloeopsis fritschii]|nr:hypothetical protein [Chlorogloeopsis fritschii]